MSKRTFKSGGGLWGVIFNRILDQLEVGVQFSVRGSKLQKNIVVASKIQ